MLKQQLTKEASSCSRRVLSQTVCQKATPWLSARNLHSANGKRTESSIRFPKPKDWPDTRGVQRLRDAQPERANQSVQPLNKKLHDQAERGVITGVLRTCQEIKSSGIKPDSETYMGIINILAQYRLPAEIRAFMQDMLAVGLAPDVRVYNYLLKAMQLHPTSMASVIEEMHNTGLYPDEFTYQELMLGYARSDNLEMCLQTLNDLNTAALLPTLRTAEAIIDVAAKMGQARLALDLAYGFESLSARRLESHSWVRILAASADTHFEEGVRKAWAKAVDEAGIIPDEGLCIGVLSVAARSGLPELATSIIQILHSMGVTYQEYHFAPLLESFVKAGRLKDAFAVPTLMRSNSVEPTMETIAPLQAILSDADKIDEAYTLLEEAKADGRVIDITTVNAIIQAALQQHDLQRAIGVYKECAELGVTPNIDTYNIILGGCIPMKHRTLGDRIFSDLQGAGIQPTVTTYERLILLCLTQDVYEDAFVYLEEMKGLRFVPPLSVYVALVRKCFTSGDPRLPTAIQELEEVYEMPPSLMRFMKIGDKERVLREPGADQRQKQGFKRPFGPRRDDSKKPPRNSDTTSAPDP